MNNLTALSLSIISLIIMSKYISKEKSNQLTKICKVAFFTMIMWCLGLILQILFSEKYGINPMYFDYFVYIAICTMPVVIFFISNIYVNTRIKFRRIYYGFLIIPVITLLILWTNNFHHLFYKTYSVYIAETTFGSYFYIYTIYQYVFLFIAIYKLLKYSIKNSGFFSTQSLLILIGISIPVIVNLLGTFKIISMTIYITPICFTFTLLLLSIAMFKFSFLKTAPIALQKIVDRISDGYIVLDENELITDFNKTFLKMFNLSSNDLRNKSFEEFCNNNSKFNVDVERFNRYIKKVKETQKMITFEHGINEIEKIFQIEINNIYSNDNFIGTLILFKDITQHKNDLKIIENNQYVMQRQAQFAILGEFAGGLAHDLNSPLSAVQLDVSTLKKYMKSDKISAEPQVKDIIGEMLENIDSSLDKMAQIIAGVRNQIRSSGDTEKEEFSLKEVIDGVEILFSSLLRKTNCKLENLVIPELKIFGEKNKLDRVIGNIVKNSIDAYVEKESRGEIIISANLQDNKCIISIEDKAGGIPDEVSKILFKEMKTTKKDKGTGFGLYYCNTIIEGSFNGRMYFDTIKGEGTIFYIEIPMIKEVI